MKSFPHRPFAFLLASLIASLASSIPAADKPDKSAERPQIEPAEPKVPENIRTLLEDRKYVEAMAAIEKAASEKDADQEWLAYLKARALYLAGKYDEAVAAYKAAEQNPKFSESQWQ